MRRVASLVALAALMVPAAAQAHGPAHPSKRYCKKHAHHLTKKQRRWCKRKTKRSHATSSPAPAPSPGPLTQPPAVSPIAPTSPTPTSTSAPAPAARLAVGAREYSFTLSHQQIASGPAIVELDNSGEDPHDLRIEPLDGSPATDFPITGAGDHTTERLTLAPGGYRLICTLGNHASLGMDVTLTVGP